MTKFGHLRDKKWDANEVLQVTGLVLTEWGKYDVRSSRGAHLRIWRNVDSDSAFQAAYLLQISDCSEVGATKRHNFAQRNKAY